MRSSVKRPAELPKVRRVLYVGIVDPTYPRNARIRRYLERELGAQVSTVYAVREGGRLRRHLKNFIEVVRQPGPWDAVVLAELSLSMFWVSWLKSRLSAATHAVDFFVGLEETLVEDWQLFDAKSIRGRLASLTDTLALRGADVIFADTDVRGEALRPRVRAAASVAVLPVGAPDWARRIQSAKGPSSANPLRILYYGNYIELHGVEHAIRALDQLREWRTFKATFIGDGRCKPRSMSLAQELGLEPIVRFVGPVPEDNLLDFILNHHVVLGVFGGSRKASTVIANKVWQGLSAGRQVVTRESPALIEIADIAGPLLRQVRAEDPHAIAVALAALPTHELEHQSRTQVAAALEAYVDRRFRDAFAWLGNT